MQSRHVSRVISASPQSVYEFAANPDNLPSWASGLAQSDVTREGDTLWVESPMGRVSVRFVEPNEFGILDHDVTLPSGVSVTNPVRVMSHPDGAEIVFTVRQLDLTDDEFERDAVTVGEDLDRLRRLVEDLQR
ncbi:SRPBCC family protein [Agreia pratensis]|uniref:Polyketide cyclase / dehydrase and lipid transport n=1 Tax=Agreia pratensis TaxID=150121 RepID=A0A1X7KGK8_9MICO|nr:SRPBCC family protein [Agreia pratensis]SMG40409.1 Polyketide cyclase / dehydrase and lipid transport [Agreia pratensis]